MFQSTTASGISWVTTSRHERVAFMEETIPSMKELVPVLLVAVPMTTLGDRSQVGAKCESDCMLSCCFYFLLHVVLLVLMCFLHWSFTQCFWPNAGMY
jgi:hypothetical protein